MDYSVGDTVVYGGSGVCEISEIKDVSFGRERPQKYYILKPLFVNQAMVVYVPMKNENLVAKMQPIISRDEAINLIKDINNMNIDWIEDRNLRKDTYNDILSSGERKDIIAVIRVINSRRKILEEDGKTLNMQDEKILYEAQKRMDAEFAVALDIGIEDVYEYIEKAKSAS
ncbi:MAG: hypothetical protein MJ093_02135 [Saccharofermentans sp.]|nr:hypothetical protein [Saccharofermentans sp.]